MRGLDQRYRQSGTNRAQRGNLSQLGGDAMFATLRQKFASRLLAQVLQHVQLLIELLGTAASSGMGYFFQPLTAMSGVVDVPARAGDCPTAVQRFQPIHDPGKIFDDG
jgi:hypothetical protein